MEMSKETVRAITSFARFRAYQIFHSDPLVKRAEITEIIRLSKLSPEFELYAKECGKRLYELAREKR